LRNGCASNAVASNQDDSNQDTDMARKDDLTPENLPKQEQQQEQAREETPQPEFALTEEEAQRAMEFFRQQQNLFAGTLAGLVAAVTGAAIWAAVTVATEYQIGWMAVGIGFLVGVAVRQVGKGVDQVFGIVGAVMALLGCVLGNVFTVAYFIARQTGTPLTEVLTQIDADTLLELLASTFQVMDLLFYAMAVYFGYRYAFRELTMDDFDRALGRAM
jgi:FtsH-binding integral membrane protein